MAGIGPDELGFQRMKGINMRLDHGFLDGLTHGLRPFRAALPLLWKGFLALLVGTLAGITLVLVGADRLGGAVVVLVAVVGSFHFVAAWVQMIRASVKGNCREEGSA